MSLPFNPARVALIGVSGYGGTHLKALNALEERGLLKLQAATVINQAEVPEKCEQLQARGCRIYSRYQEMLQAEAGGIDLCCIPTGIPWHGEMTVAALETGCHVLVEKPAAGSVQEVDEMIRARNAAERQVAVGFQHLYQESFSAMKREIAAGRIGRLREIRIRASWPRSSAYYGRNEWAGRVQVGNRWVLDSPANNACAHFLMAALGLASSDLLQAANAVAVEAELYRTQDIESFDTISARIQTDAGVPIFFALTHSCEVSDDPIIQLYGDSGLMSWQFDNSLSIRFNGHIRFRRPLAPQWDARHCMLERILAQIRGEEPEACPLEEARKHTLLMNTLHESIPIWNVPEAYRVSRPSPNGTQSVILGINETVQAAFEKGALFSEFKVPWAVGACAAEIRPMREFSGPMRLQPVGASGARMAVAAGE